MANIRGVDLFWPSPIRVVMPGKIAYRLEVGSKAEMIVLCSMLVFCAGLYPMSSLGLRGGLHQLLKDFDIAYDEYVEVQGLNWHTLELKAIDNLTLEHIECNCPILGAWQNGLIVEFNGKARSVGKSQLHHNLYPVDAVLIKGEPLRVILAARGHERPLVALAGGQPSSQPRLLSAGRAVRRCGQGGQRQPDRGLSSGHLGRKYGQAALRQGGGFARVSESDRNPGRGGGAVLVEAGR
jgi:hypothetical protein